MAAPIDPLADPLGAGLEAFNSGAGALAGGLTGGVDAITSFPDSVTKLFVCGDVPAEVTPEPEALPEPAPEVAAQ